MENIIKLFEEVRDLPYHCPEDLTGNDYRCWGKNRILFNTLKDKGQEVRFGVCGFKWNEQRLPKEITSRAPTEEDIHLFLELKIGDEWCLLDASNDSRLPSYNKWDGKSNCELAVKPSKIYTPEESAILERKEFSEFKERFQENKEFYKELNSFIDNIRH